MRDTVLNRAAAIAAIATISACAAPVNRALESAQREGLQSTDVVLMIPQTELVAVIRQTNAAAATGTGALGALVEGSVNSAKAAAANEAMRPLNAQLRGYDLDTRLKEELERSLAGVRWLSPTGIAVSKEAGGAAARVNTLRASQASAVLFVDVAYGLRAGLAGACLIAEVRLMPAAPGRKLSEVARIEPIYANTFTVEGYHEPRARWDGEARRWWSDNDLLKRTLEFSVSEIARLVATDLNAGAALTDSSATKVVRTSNGAVLATLNLAQLPAPQPAIATTPAAEPAAEPAAAAATSAEAAPEQPAAPAEPAAASAVTN